MQFWEWFENGLPIKTDSFDFWVGNQIKMDLGDNFAETTPFGSLGVQAHTSEFDPNLYLCFPFVLFFVDFLSFA